MQFITQSVCAHEVILRVLMDVRWVGGTNTAWGRGIQKWVKYNIRPVLKIIWELFSFLILFLLPFWIYFSSQSLGIKENESHRVYNVFVKQEREAEYKTNKTKERNCTGWDGRGWRQSWSRAYNYSKYVRNSTQTFSISVLRLVNLLRKGEIWRMNI